MKIIFLGGNFNHSGGTERVASIIANDLSKRGHDVVIASTCAGDSPFFNLSKSIQLRSLFKKAGRGIFRAPLLIARIRKLLIAEKPDTLIVVESMLALFTVPATIALPIKHICWEHFNFKNDNGHKGRRVARHLAARFCDVVVTLTEKDRSFWLANTCKKAQIVVIPNPSPFAVQFAHAPENNQVVLAVGRLVSQKGFDLLLAAWKLVSRVATKWKLRIVGDGPDHEALIRLATDLSIQHTVDFVGATAAIEQHYKQAAIYCLSSRFEGFPMVLLEAISFGLPVVSFDCDCGPAEILAQTEARLVPSGDVDALARSLLALIHSPISREHISKLSKDKAAFYQPDVIMNHWLKLLSQN